MCFGLIMKCLTGIVEHTCPSLSFNPLPPIPLLDTPPSSSARPALPCPFPSSPAAEITVNLANLRPDIRSEWDELKQHDVLFLLTLRPPDSITANYMAQASLGRGPGWTNASDSGLAWRIGCWVGFGVWFNVPAIRQHTDAAASSFCSTCLLPLQNGQGTKEGGVGVMERFGLQYVRGCEVVEVRDEGESGEGKGAVGLGEQAAPTGKPLVAAAPCCCLRGCTALLRF